MSFTDYEKSLIIDKKRRSINEKTEAERQINARAAAVINTSDKLDYFELLVQA